MDDNRERLLKELMERYNCTLAAYNRHGDGLIASALTESKTQFFWYRWDYRGQQWDNVETWNKQQFP